MDRKKDILIEGPSGLVVRLVTEWYEPGSAPGTPTRQLCQGYLSLRAERRVNRYRQAAHLCSKQALGHRGWPPSLQAFPPGELQSSYAYANAYACSPYGASCAHNPG